MEVALVIARLQLLLFLLTRHEVPKAWIYTQADQSHALYQFFSPALQTSFCLNTAQAQLSNAKI